MDIEEYKDFDRSHSSVFDDEYGVPGNGHTHFPILRSPKPVLDTQDPYFAFPIMFLFANPNSGSQKARYFMELEAEKMIFNTHKLQCCLYIYNILDKDSKLAGMENLKHITQTHKVKIAVAGGDGSSVYVLQDIIRASVPLAQLEFILLPFGTGNDLPAYLGWGRKPTKPITDPILKSLRKLIKKWLEGVPSHLDLWDVEISVDNEGTIGVVHRSSKGFNRMILGDASGKPVKTLKRLMNCYLGIGIDGRIGLNFDKHRTSHRSLNKLVYIWEGFKKVVCMAHTKVMDFTTEMSAFEDGNLVSIYDKKRPLYAKDSVLLAMNIDTYLGANCKVWNSAKKTDSSRVYEPQKPNDNLLEWLTFTGYGIALERGIKGRGKKLYQGKGPFVISMKNPSKQHRVYLHIDGEHFFLTNPIEIKVSLSKYTSDFKVLINK